MSEGQAESKVKVSRSNLGLASCYVIYGVLVSGFFFLVGAVNSQAARSATEANTVVAAAILSAMPMFITGIALGFGWRWARRLAIVLPAVLAVCGLERFFGTPINLLSDRAPVVEFIGYFCFIQIRNLPGAIVLALVALALDEPHR
jgi:hypothetical protein